MRKLVSVIASAVMLTCFSAAPLTAHADNGVTFEVGTVSTAGAVANGVLEQEEIVIVPVNITENQGVASFLLEFSQDSNIEILEAKSKDSSYISKNGVNGGFTWNVDALRLLWIENSCQDVNVCGLVVNLEVKVPAGTPAGKYEIGFKSEEIQVTNTNFDSIEFTLLPGYVEVGGNPAENPPVQTEPAATQSPATQPPDVQNPAATQSPATQPAVTKPQAAQAPASTTKAQETSKAETTTKNSVSTVSSANTDKPETSSAVSDNDEIDVQLDESINVMTEMVSDTASESESAENTDKSDSSESDSSETDSVKKSNSKKNSPATGVSSGEIAVIGTILVVSAAGVVIALKSKKGKK